MTAKDTINTLIVDDSPLVRKVLSDILEQDPQISVIGTANDPYEAVSIIQKKVPDVITLDIEMPRMDGLTFLKKLMKQHPIPVIILSSHTAENKSLALKAFENGALYVMNKPEIADEAGFKEYTGRLQEIVKLAARHSSLKKNNLKIKKFHTDEQINDNLSDYLTLINHPVNAIAIGASAGGTIAIQTILCQISQSNPPPIFITQHMPAGFTKEFASRLNELCSLNVVEADDDMEIRSGSVYIAPGDKHMTLVHHRGKTTIRTQAGPLVNHHRPSVDVLFNSMTEIIGPNCLAFLCTGMGRDGALGLLELKKAGATCFAQDQNSSVVFGMPQEALRIGAAHKEIPLDHIGPLISSITNRKTKNYG